LPLPNLQNGLIIQYEYLWSAGGQARKDRPACVIVFFRPAGSEIDHVTYLPITHTEPEPPSVGIEIPSAIRRIAGLDDVRQWIIISEYSADKWPFDVRQIPGKPGRYDYGVLPEAFFNTVSEHFTRLFRARHAVKVIRTDP
jgi:hypothetical protein